MTREELTAKNKADLLALAQGANLAATPAMTKNDLVELLLANAQLTAATPAPVPAPSVDISTAAPVVAPDVLVPDNGAGLPKEGSLRSLDGQLAGGRKMRVTIMATEHEKEDVKLGVNGHLVQIKRGVPVVIDEAYVEVLKNSTIDTIVEDDTGKRSQAQMQRYPFIAEPA